MATISGNAKFVSKAGCDFLENIKLRKSMKDKTLLSEKVCGEGVTCHPSHSPGSVPVYFHLVVSSDSKESLS